LNYCGLSAVIEKIAIEVDIAHGEPIGYLVEFSGNGPVLRHGILAKTV
jgi:hypothetical protein